MVTDVAEVSGTPLSHLDIKVHGLMCTELMKFVSRVSILLPEIEAARPNCSSGIKTLCLLNAAIFKAKSLLQYCSESSKLYLAVTGDAILLRCKKSRNLLEQSLNQVQNMVPVSLAEEIRRLIDELRSAIFSLDPSEKEAGKVLTDLLHLYSSTTDSTEERSLEAIQVAMQRLCIASLKALVIEKKSIKKMLGNLRDNMQPKKKILLIFLNLLNKHGKSIVTEQTENSFPYENSHLKRQHDDAQGDQLLESFTSIASLSSSMNDLILPIGFNVSHADVMSQEGNDSCHEVPIDMHEMNVNTLAGLGSLSWESQCVLVRNIGNFSERNDRACGWMSSEVFVQTIIRFLKDAQGFQDLNAQILGCQLLLKGLQKFRSSLPYLHDDAFALLSSLLGTRVSKEALAVLEVLSCHQYCQNKIAASGALTPILDMMKARNQHLQELAIKILRNLSENSTIASEFVPKLIPFLEDPVLTRDVLIILKNSCVDEDCRACAAAVPSVVKLLDSENHEYQQHAVEFLHLLCSQHNRYVQLIDEVVIVGLVSISVNGNNNGREIARKLLKLLRCESDNFGGSSGPNVDNPKGSTIDPMHPKSTSKAQGLFKKLFKSKK